MYPSPRKLAILVALVGDSTMTSRRPPSFTATAVHLTIPCLALRPADPAVRGGYSNAPRRKMPSSATRLFRSDIPRPASGQPRTQSVDGRGSANPPSRAARSASTVSVDRRSTEHRRPSRRSGRASVRRRRPRGLRPARCPPRPPAGTRVAGERQMCCGSAAPGAPGGLRHHIVGEHPAAGPAAVSLSRSTRSTAHSSAANAGPIGCSSGYGQSSIRITGRPGRPGAAPASPSRPPRSESLEVVQPRAYAVGVVGRAGQPGVGQPDLDVGVRVEDLALHHVRVAAGRLEPAAKPVGPVLTADVRPVAQDLEHPARVEQRGALAQHCCTSWSPDCDPSR